MQLWVQRLLPHHLASRAIRLLSHCRIKWLKNYFIHKLIREHQVDISEAKPANINEYEHFNAFFTRTLLPKARPINDSPHLLVSPADGTISQMGIIKDNHLIQAKNKNYTLAALLGNNTPLENIFNQGYFTTIYLSPKDYHRVHMPIDGTLSKMIYIPGKLFSVNQATTSQVENLFAINERVICCFETKIGTIAIVFVGAIFVGSIATVWHGSITPPYRKKIQQWSYPLSHKNSIHLKKGEEIGHFDMGSTVIMLLPPYTNHPYSPACRMNQTIKMGEGLIRIP